MFSYLDGLKNRWAIIGVFSLLMLIPALFYALASFYHVLHPKRTMVIAIVIAILFAMVEYVFKVPLIAFGYRKGLTRKEVQIIWILVTFLTVAVMDYWRPNPKAL